MTFSEMVDVFSYIRRQIYTNIVEDLLPVSSALKMKPAGTYLPYYMSSCPRIQHSSWCYILFNFFLCATCVTGFFVFFYMYCLTNKVY